MKDYNWNLKDIFATDEEFEQSKEEFYKILGKIEGFKGNLKTSENIYKCYKNYEKAYEIFEKLYAYGMLSYHLDMKKSENVKLYKSVEKFSADFGKATSFITPEITELKEEEIIKFEEENKDLSRYKRILDEIIEDKKHILSKQEENLLANYSEVFGTMENTFDILTNTEFEFGNINMEDGTQVKMTDATYTKFLKDKDVKIREQAFNLMYKKYSEFLNTIAELYLAKVKMTTTTAKIRKYESSLDMAVKHDDSTMKVYNSLITAIHEKMNVNHQFMELKKKMLKLDDMHLYDIYVNPIEVGEDKIEFEEAKEEVLLALKVLGKEYNQKLQEAFNQNWLDVYEKPNKMGGAYSMGVYNVHPYVLLNFVSSKRDVSTIAHELGHSMHTYFSNKNQNVFDSSYTIMVAEIASTTNEILLAKYQINNEKNKAKKAEIIYELLEMIRATLFRQSMFAEFEREVHSKIENGEMLSAEDLNNIYYELNKMYFGESTVIDENIKYEWARIPHFYTPFYVYKYATGISASIVIAKNILEKGEEYVKKYLDMLSQGCNKKSVDLLKMVDVDLESKETYESAIEFYQSLTKELEELI